MRWFFNMSVSRKLLMGFSMVAFLACAVGVTGLYNIKKLQKADEAMYEKAAVPILYAGQIARDYQKIRVSLRDILRAKNVDTIRKSRDAMTKLDESIRANIKIMSDIAGTTSREHDEKVSILLASYSQLYQLVLRIAQESEDGKTAVVDQLMVAPSTLATLAKIDKAVNDVNHAYEEYAKSVAASNRDIVSMSFIVLGGSVIFALAAALFLGIFISLSITRPLKKGLEFAKKLADGDLTGRIDLQRNDELGRLASSLNTAADDLERMVSDIINGSRNLVQAIQEISAGNENLSQRTSEQASALEEVASTLEQTSSSITQNADNSKRANDLAETTLTFAENGGIVVNEAVKAINEINEASAKIEAVTTVINEIAFQTNLLALNAAVEAARAGEAGRGFAVVAGEVRNLAQRSGSSVKEIGELIKSTLDKVSIGTSMANKSGESLQDIIRSMKEVRKFTSEIAAASDEQKQGASQINVAVGELDSMTQQNAGLVEENASASEEIANQAQELLMQMERFKISEDMNGDVITGIREKSDLRRKVAKTAIKKSPLYDETFEEEFEQAGVV